MGKLVDDITVDPISGGDPYRIDPAQDVQLCEGELGECADGHRVSKGHHVKPPNSSGPSGGGPELLSLLSKIACRPPMELCRQWTFADRGRVGLDHAHDVFDGGWRNAHAGASASRKCRRRGNVGIRAPIEIAHNSELALQEDALIRREVFSQYGNRRTNIVAKPVTPGLNSLQDLLH